MSDRSKVARSIVSLVVAYLDDNPFATNTDVARAIESDTEYSFNTIRVAIPMALEMARQAQSAGKAALGESGLEDSNDSYVFNATHYTFFFKNFPDVVLGRRVVADLVWYYSNDGGKLSRAEVVGKLKELHGETLSEKYVARLLRTLQVTKTSSPFAPHLREKYTPEELAKIWTARKEAEIQVSLKDVGAREWEKRYTKLLEQQASRDLMLNMLTDAVRDVPTTQAYEYPDSEMSGLAVCAAYDIHIGKGDSRETVQAHLDDFDQAARKLASSLMAHARPERVLVVFGGDYFNIDSVHNTTTAGTPQDMGVGPREMIDLGVRAACRYIEAMRPVAPVDVLVIPGNHDEMLTWSLQAAIGLRYEGDDGVSVLSAESSRAYYAFHENLLGFEHGDGPKASDLGMIMATEQRKMWGECENVYWFVGHLHHVREYETGGAMVFQVPALCSTDRFHHKKGYVTSGASHRAFLFDEKLGHYATFVARRH